jgi:hypothetical protein
MKILGFKLPSSVGVSRSLGSPDSYGVTAVPGQALCGVCELGANDFAEAFDCFGVYQMRQCKEGRIPVKMKFYNYRYTNSEKQIRDRTKMRNAVLAWQNLTPEAKAWYRKKAELLPQTGYSLFIREFLLAP